MCAKHSISPIGCTATRYSKQIKIKYTILAVEKEIDKISINTERERESYTYRLDTSIETKSSLTKIISLLGFHHLSNQLIPYLPYYTYLFNYIILRPH